MVANADQTDSDKNGTGDACGPTFAQVPVSGSVPATLALTLGSTATFGAFTPGVDRSYDATTTANVISTAGDAALSVSDPSTTATGRLVNGAFSLPEPLQAGANGPLAPVEHDRGIAAVAAQVRRPGQQRRDHDRVPPAHRPYPGAPHGRVQQAPDLHAVDHDPVTRSVSGKETA